MTDEERNGLLLDVILAALKGFIETNCAGKDDDSEDARRSGAINFSYLLGQSIRQWQIPLKNWHVSQAAKEAWEAMGAKRIDGGTAPMGYKEQFVCIKDIFVPTFSGTKKDFSEIDSNFSTAKSPNYANYVFNNVFIAEHTTPVSDIKDAIVTCYRELEEKGELNDTILRAKVLELLDKIHITQMLKIEDRRINECSARVRKIKNNEAKILEIEKRAKEKIAFEKKAVKNTIKHLPKEEQKKINAEIRDKIRNEKDQEISKLLYNYLSETKSEDVFADLCDCCYKDLIFGKNKSKPSEIVLEKAASLGWASAVDVEKEYKIFTINEYL